ncbi:pyruvate formate lyase-activating protein [Bacillus sp. FJAT-49705]|uniref:Pyruvate formate-lyase-activating enzyme n=1 Tax=Cytobacillus citreus TaxID=2833586 RepID=A0ABS5P0N2_9BACI|nr:pyruvate formate-lyase-activating protein [Cytobacillus citreus]MBS4193304.1 pyruvate formate lyase-activating protein [Cytobacillus citreus]
MKGHIHSIETCGTVDGPGIRYIVFTQGCLLRCQYCHNADTWEIGKGKSMTVEEIIDDLQSYIPFIEASRGGITVSGGEPLLQLDFLIALLKKCKKIGVHTAIDTSGGCYTNEPVIQAKLDQLMEYTDLVLLDLKHIDPKRHQKLTGKPNEHILQFARYLSDKKKPVWIRHVLVPGITDEEEDLRHLRAFIDTLKNVEKVEVLPYHQLGVYKWEQLGHKYPLKGVQPPAAETIAFANQILVKN